MEMLDLREQSRQHMPKLVLLPSLQLAAIATWQGRMLNEYASGRNFEGLAPQLRAAGMNAKVVADCLEFADEERHHGVLCGAVVEALGGVALAQLPDPAEFPQHEEVGPVETALRNLLHMCCLSETVAVSLVGAERLEMPEGQLRDLLTTIYADEVGHSNFGWRLLPRLLELGDDAMKQRLGVYLRVAFAHFEQHELEHLPMRSAPPQGSVYGLCSGSDGRALFYDTVDLIIIPALEAQGIPAREAWNRRGQDPPIPIRASS